MGGGSLLQKQPCDVVWLLRGTVCHLRGSVSAAHRPSAPLSIAAKRESIIPLNSCGNTDLYLALSQVYSSPAQVCLFTV